MIVGSVLPRPCADKQKIKGLTALPVPTTMVVPLIRCYRKPLYARIILLNSKVMSSAATAHVV